MSHPNANDYLFSLMLGSLQTCCRALSEEFATTFRVWTRTEGRLHSLDLGDDQQSEGCDDISAVLSTVWPNDSSQILCIPVSGRSHLVVVPPRQNTGADVPMVAAGIIQCDSGEFVPRLVENLLGRLECESSLADNEAHFAEYAYQVTTDFEELTWLRSLADQIEICDIQKDLATVASVVLPTLIDLIKAEAIALMIADEASGSPVVRGASHCRFVTGEAPIDEPTRIKLVQENWREAIDQPLVRNAPARDHVTEATFGMRNFILVQIARSEHQYGWLLVMNRHVSSHTKRGEGINASCLSEWEFGTFEAGLLNAASIMLATHARNCELFGEKEQLIIGMIRAMMNAIDAKDPYTCGHSDRVALVSKRLAEELGLSRGECERIYMSGLLHDVGKIGVPDDVLCKPGPLTEEEFAKIKLHPQIGFSILRHVQQLQYVLPGVLHHHEAVNGRGYPAGLAGDDIPLPGRILAVADAFDAMTSSRAYRKAMPISKAESIFREGAGTQWDARIVDALMSALPDIQLICQKDVQQREESNPEALPPGGYSGSVDFITAAVSAMESV